MPIVARLLLVLPIVAALCAGGVSGASAHHAAAEVKMAERMAHAVHHMAPDAEACDMSIAHCATAVLPWPPALAFERAPCPVRHASASIELAELAKPDLDTPPPRSRAAERPARGLRHRPSASKRTTC